jgi:hypothetical protein
LKGYQWKERAAALKGGLFRYGPTVGLGWANVKLSEEGSGNQKMEEVEADYTKKEVADFENLHLQIVRKPLDENCWFSPTEGNEDGSGIRKRTFIKPKALPASRVIREIRIITSQKGKPFNKR